MGTSQRNVLSPANGVIDELGVSFSMLASEAHISEVTLGHDKKISEPTEDFHSDDTIFAAVEISENTKTVKVKGRLHIVEVEGQKAGPIPGIEAIVTLSGEGILTFSSVNQPRAGHLERTSLWLCWLMETAKR